MGRTRNSGLGIGAGSAPQGNVSQCKVDEKIQELSEQEIMISELEETGVKFNRNDVLFVVKDKTGQMLWLENGNQSAGLEHIKKHTKDFEEKHGIKPDNLVDHLHEVIANGEAVSVKKKMLENGKIGIEKIYCLKGKYYVLGAIGTNGFIVSMYPLDGGKKNENN